MSSSGINFEKLTEESGAVVEKLNRIPAHATVSTSGTLTIGELTPVNAESGEITQTLPTPKELGNLIAIEKTDSSVNAVKISGTIRGESTSATLKLKREIILYEAESKTSWRPISDHKTLGSLDERYPLSVGFQAGQVPISNGSGLWSLNATDFYNPLKPPFNAIADGTYHSLESRFGAGSAGLEAAQKVYPFATIITQQIDWAAIQLAINTAAGKGSNGPGTNFTATTTNTGKELTSVSSFTGLGQGVPVKGTNIPSGTVIVSCNVAANTAIMSNAATGSGSVTITPGAGGGVVYIPAKPFVVQNQVQMAGYIHVWGASGARTAAEGISVGSVITTFSNGVIVSSNFTAKTNTSTSLTEISSFTNLFPLCPISGTGIPVGTHIVSINEGASSAVLSQAATATATGVAITPGRAMFNTNGCQNWGLHRVSLNYVGTPGPVTSEGNIAMAISDFSGEGKTGSGLATVEGCYFNNFGGTSVIGLYGNVNFIFQNRFDNAVGDLIRIANSGNAEVGSDGYISFNSAGFNYGNGSNPGSVGDGIRIEEGGYYLVASNDMYNCGNGINIVNAPNNRVIGNRCEKNDFAGIRMGGAQAWDNTVLGNLCFNNGYASASGVGITILENSLRNNINGNFILNEMAGATGGEFTAEANNTTTLKKVKASGGGAKFSNLRVGALIFNASKIQIGTYITAVNEGTEEVTTSLAVEVTEAITLKAMPTFIGINVSGTVSRNSVSGNFMYNINQNGINLSSATYNNITNNFMDTCGRDGILVSGTSNNNLLSSNYSYNCSQFTASTYSGIEISSGTGNMVIGCMHFNPATLKAKYGVNINGATAVETQVIDCYCTTGNFGTAAFHDSGEKTIVRNFRGYVVGEISVSVPASATAVTAVSYDRYFYVKSNVAGTTKLKISNGPTIEPAVGALVNVFVPAGQTLTPEYTVSDPPTWVVHGYAD